MTTYTRRVDQWIQIGRDIRVMPTDIDPAGIRLLVKGRVMGGSHDGEPFENAYELLVGQDAHLGPHLVINIVEIRGDSVRLGVLAPANIPIYTKEQIDELRKGNS